MDVDIISTRALHVVDTQLKLTDREVYTLWKYGIMQNYVIPKSFNFHCRSSGSWHSDCKSWYSLCNIGKSVFIQNS